MSETLTLANPQQAKAALDAAFERIIKPMTMAGHRLMAVIKTETRKDAQSAHFHSLIGQISTHIGGDLADKDDAKRILLSAFKIDTKDMPELAREWAKFGELRMAFEIQLSTTFIRVIAERREFYLREGGLLVWLFASFIVALSTTQYGELN